MNEVEISSFDAISRRVLEIIQDGDDCPREFRAAFDDALQHGWPADDCTMYAFANFFYNLGKDEE